VTPEQLFGVSYTVVPPLVLAQAFCWYSVITLDHLGQAIEQSRWTATMGMVGVSLAVAAGHLDGGMFWVAWTRGAAGSRPQNGRPGGPKLRG
jgi:hypothetical protein